MPAFAECHCGDPAREKIPRCSSHMRDGASIVRSLYLLHDGGDTEVAVLPSLSLGDSACRRFAPDLA